jgi:hypothetical protein
MSFLFISLNCFPIPFHHSRCCPSWTGSFAFTLLSHAHPPSPRFAGPGAGSPLFPLLLPILLHPERPRKGLGTSRETREIKNTMQGRSRGRLQGHRGTRTSPSLSILFLLPLPFFSRSKKGFLVGGVDKIHAYSYLPGIVCSVLMWAANDKNSSEENRAYIHTYVFNVPTLPFGCVDKYRATNVISQVLG